MKGIEVTYKGIEYESISELAEDYAIDLGVLYRRLKMGWDIDKAITTPVVRKKAYYGKKYPYEDGWITLREIADRTKLPYKYVYHWVVKRGLKVDIIMESAYCNIEDML